MGSIVSNIIFSFFQAFPQINLKSDETIQKNSTDTKKQTSSFRYFK